MEIVGKHNAKILKTELAAHQYIHDVALFVSISFDFGCNLGSIVAHMIPIDQNAILKILDAAGVNKWEDLEGTYVRIEYDSIGVAKMGHIVENRCVSFREIIGAHVKGQAGA